MARDRKKWQNSTKEAVIDAERKIFDSHFHLTDPVVESRGEISKAAKLKAKIPTNYLRYQFIQFAFPQGLLNLFTKYVYMVERYEWDNLVEDFGGHNIVKGLQIESGWEDASAYENKKEFGNVVESARVKARNEEMKAKNIAFRMATACHVDLFLGYEKVKQGIEKHLEVNPDVKSLRHQLAFDKDDSVFSAFDAKENMHENEDFLAGLKAVAEKKLTFEAWCYHKQLNQVQVIAEKIPELTIVLNHIGSPIGSGKYGATNDAKEEVKKEWQEKLTALSGCANVHVKLSGLTMPGTAVQHFHNNSKAPTSDQVVEAFFPWIKTTYELFGVDRCLFASNFPVDKVGVSYPILWNAFKKIADKLEMTDADKDKVFHDNATKLYNY